MISSPSKIITNNHAAPIAANKIAGIPADMAKGIAQFTGGWAVTGPGAPGAGAPLRQRKFKFTAYLAKYSGGDWDSTVRIQDGKIVTGSLPNLLYIMKKWSQEKIDATPDPVPLDLAGDQLFAVKPPFVFFTGHRDFKLTDTEVANLQKYLRLGG